TSDRGLSNCTLAALRALCGRDDEGPLPEPARHRDPRGAPSRGDRSRRPRGAGLRRGRLPGRPGRPRRAAGRAACRGARWRAPRGERTVIRLPPGAIAYIDADWPRSVDGDMSAIVVEDGAI